MIVTKNRSMHLILCLFFAFIALASAGIFDKKQPEGEPEPEEVSFLGSIVSSFVDVFTTDILKSLVLLTVGGLGGFIITSAVWFASGITRTAIVFGVGAVAGVIITSFILT
uniref:Uncharacterized protein n=1 Tax=Fibrocapsa japonica TaxID=94617 RepID=A0A7S2XWJ4_9STRA|eukprot:CAMPEP_0113943040 /NCGR_PEP_ID=MMETSP1339-20121228/17096_1 /TAXON_ID=94617 /ORGANISM="Fibrocapsa japonica" /LENGTH=110 /DNA_ID=CAMNT_0000947775 /DNA_START=58 /DNA_END=390 /DNA_ORIENTATION=+ /assembly_acc=CAM_ASM_000762